MQCWACGFENPDGMKFCGGCGQPLPLACANCGSAVPADFKFCGNCGAAQASRAETAAAKKAEPEAERRHVTVMFCDVVGSTELAGRLDPEELREVIHDYQSACERVIRQFGGHIAQYLGDGLLVYFGFPQAHEDDARRSVHTGLGIIDAVARLNDRLLGEHGLAIAVRVGIHVGPVVAGEIGSGERRERLALGQTPNMAERLQSLADPDTVVLSGDLYQLVQGFFEFEFLGPRDLKGAAVPVDVYRALRPTGVRSRFEVTLTEGLSPLVGRDRELRSLLERFHEVQEGRGQVVLVSGEAGIGKSRLVEMFRQETSTDAQWLIARCSPYHQNSAFNPIIDCLGRHFRFEADEPPKAKLGKMEEALAPLGLSPQEVIPLFANLLSVPLENGYAPPAMSPHLLREKTLETLMTVFHEMSSTTEPLVFVVEDLHWVDPSTLDLIDQLVRYGPARPVMTVLTFRPDYRPTWGAKAHLGWVALDSLDKAQVTAMVTHLTRGKSLPKEVVAQVIEKTDGVPIFVEELTKMVIESGQLDEGETSFELAGALPSLTIPATLQASLMARLDRLSAAKDVAQTASIIGREFTYDVLSAVVDLDQQTLQRELDQLVDAELVYPSGSGPKATYTFKHALIQDAAYSSLLKRTRQRQHKRIAEALEERFPNTAETQPELLAHHYTESSVADKAIEYWRQAGQRAADGSHNLEAIGHIDRGLALARDLPDEMPRWQMELGLQTTLAPVMAATKGYSSPEVETVCNRALELCERIGDTPELFFVLWGMGAFYQARAEFQKSLELGHQLMRLAEQQDDPALYVEAYFGVGSNLFFMGQFEEALENLESGLARYAELRGRTDPSATPQDSEVILMGYAGLVMEHLGLHDEALARVTEAANLARERSHPFSLVYAMLLRAWVMEIQGDAEETRRVTEEANAMSEGFGFPDWLAWGRIFLGSAFTRGGDPERGLAEIEAGLELYEKIGTKAVLTLFHAILAEACAAVGRVQEAESLLEQTIGSVERTGERFWEPELHRQLDTLRQTLASQ